MCLPGLAGKAGGENRCIDESFLSVKGGMRENKDK